MTFSLIRGRVHAVVRRRIDRNHINLPFHTGSDSIIGLRIFFFPKEQHKDIGDRINDSSENERIYEIR